MSGGVRVLRVLVVDDSPLFTEMISGVLGADPMLNVAGVATNGRQAVEMVAELRPDVITMDIQMPEMDGLEAIGRIMTATPTPILVVTGDPRGQGEELHFEALRRGALDVMAKEEIWTPAPEKREKLLEHLKFLAGVPVFKHRRRGRQRPTTAEIYCLPATSKEPAPDLPPERVVAIVASTGGPSALAQILEALPAGFPTGILVVQHIGHGFSSNLATWLDDVSPLTVRVAVDGGRLVPGKVMVAPEGFHMTVARGGRVRLEKSPPLEGHLPSGTRMLASVAETYGRHAIGLILTGMGKDGVEGLRAIGEAGGATLAQDEASSVVYGMPKVAVETGAAQTSLPLDEIPDRLCELAGMRPKR